jgi:hypothetical protein
MSAFEAVFELWARPLRAEEYLRDPLADEYSFRWGHDSSE